MCYFITQMATVASAIQAESNNSSIHFSHTGGRADTGTVTTAFSINQQPESKQSVYSKDHNTHGMAALWVTAASVRTQHWLLERSFFLCVLLYTLYRWVNQFRNVSHLPNKQHITAFKMLLFCTVPINAFFPIMVFIFQIIQESMNSTT